MVDDVIATTEANLKKYQIKSLTEIKNARKPLCQFSTEMGSQVTELKQILRKNFTLTQRFI